MQYRIETRGGLFIVGHSVVTSNLNNQSNIDIPNFWNEYMNSGAMNVLHKEDFLVSDTEYGICIPLKDCTNRFKYLIGVEAKRESDTRDYDFIEIAEQLYAIFTTPPAKRNNFSSVIQATWREIYEKWLPNSEYLFDSNGFDFELYDERCGCNLDSIVMDIYIPIKRK